MQYPKDFLNKIIYGDCAEMMQGIPDDTVDSVCTDPPYGLGTKEPDIAKVLTAWINGKDEKVNDKDFMGKDWELPSPKIWREVYRVLKPGGIVLCFAGTRTADLMGISLRLAGFEIKDTLQWLYGSGFPKSRNIWKLDIKPKLEKQLKKQGYKGEIEWK